MKRLRKVLSLVLAVCMILSMAVTVSAEGTQTQAAQTGNDSYRIVHLDAGRKYFSVDSVTTLINAMSNAGYNQLELAFGNAGLRFLLNDMSITVSDTVSYTDNEVRTAVISGNENQNSSGDERYWTETDMDKILSYAEAKGIEIVPLLNMPGHMNAVLNVNADYKLTSGGQTSDTTIDLNNEEAYAFGLALLQKYADYFKGKVNYFNFGADEYANDLYNPYFNWSSRTVEYTKCVEYINACTEIIKNAGMTPRAFNDNILFNGQTGVDTSVQVCYWSDQWASGTPYASASAIKNAGYTLINTNSKWYYVPGSEGYSIDTAAANAKSVGFDEYYVLADGGSQTVADTAGAMVCIWCDQPNALSDTETIANAVTLLNTFAESHTEQFGTSDTETDKDTATGSNPTDADPEVQETVNVTLSVGQTVQYTQENVDNTANITKADGADSIVTVNAAYEQQEGSTVANKVSSLTSGSSYYISDGNGNYLALQNGALTNVKSVDDATAWTVESYYNGYRISSGDYYLYGGSYSGLAVYTNYATTWNYDASKGFYYSPTTFNTYYITLSNGTWTIEQSPSAYGAAYTVSTTDPVNATVISFTGAAVGTTTVTVGSTKYEIEVVEEDLASAPSLTIYNFITNKPVTGDSNKSTTETITAAKAYGENGVAFAELVPATGTFRDGDNANLMQPVRLWMGKYQTGDQIQKEAGWTNKSHQGEDIERVRYYGGAWAIYNGTEWITVSTDTDAAHLTAFYIQKTTVTDEITTYVVDWGQTRNNVSDFGSAYCVLDFAVKYESGERTPDSYINSNTLTYNAVGNLDYSTEGTAYEGYRLINEIYAEETSNYEVYRITVTPSTNELSGNSPQLSYNEGNVEYETAKEMIVWAATENDIGDFADSWYDGHSAADSVGGEAVVPSLYIQQHYGMLVTYYVRAKATEDSLSVHYIDETAGGTEFYNYNIAVESGTTFHSNIGLNTPWKQNLVNGNVTNLQGETQTVSADLSTMTEIGSQYRYSDYTCTRVERSTDGKEVYLYYTFNNTHSYVVDFGLPVEINIATDLGVAGSWQSVKVTGARYGSAAADTTKITYTPAQTIRSTEILTVTLTGTDGQTAAHQVYIYPATTVYYEEGFATYTDGWTGAEKGTGLQKTEAAGSKTYVYGTDGKYIDEATGASNGTQATSTTYSGNATFTFTGTGVDVYANCDTATGKLAIMVTGSDGSLKKYVQVNTALKNGDTEATSYQAVTGYNVPVASLDLGSRDTYTVKVSHIKPNASAAGDTVNLDGFRVYGTLDGGTTAYVSDGEANPSYVELRDQVLFGLHVQSETSADYANQIARDLSQVYSTSDADAGKAIVIDANNDITSENVQDLLDNGPKNELYLKSGQSVVFRVNQDVQVGMKALNAEVTYSLNNVSEQTLKTSTDMFYEAGTGTITITNNSSNGAILAITKVKAAGTAESTDNGIQLLSLTEADLMPALLSLGFEEEPSNADAAVNVNLVDYTGTVIASTSLTANGEEGAEAVFTAEEIASLAEQILPAGYDFVDRDTIADQTTAYGESTDVNIQIGKTATLNVTYKTLFGKTKGTATLTAVQTTSAASHKFTASELRSAAPGGYWTGTLISTSVKYGETANRTVIGLGL